MRTIVILVLLVVLAVSIVGLVTGPGLGTIQVSSSQPGPENRIGGIQGEPTVTADFINRVLAANQSPAAGTGQALYQYGLDFGIDPVYPLAFFMFESSYGKTGWARVNHSIGNERCIPGYGCNGGYADFPTWEESYKAWYRLILHGYIEGRVTIPLVGHTCTTLDQIISVYAPSSENDTAAYIWTIKATVRTWRNGGIQS